MTLNHKYIFLVLVFTWVGPCLAELQPEEIAILAVRGNRGSEGLAKHYAQARGVPAENICTLIMPKGETLSRQLWTWTIRPEIQKWLTDHDPDKKIRCWVTTWAVPLRIGRAVDSKSHQQYLRFLEGERSHRMALLEQTLQSLDSLAIPVEPTALRAKPESELSEIQASLEQALQKAQARLARLTDKDQKQQAYQQLQQLATTIGGTGVLMQGLSKQLKENTQAGSTLRSNFDQLVGRLRAYSELRAVLNFMAPGIQRDVLQLQMLTRSGGLLASVKWLDEQLKMVKKDETGASFDSELSLLMWPDDYQLLRWQANYLRPEYDNSQLPKIYRTLMVARLDAPTVELAQGLVDTAIQVESQGLQGKIYIDARGIGKLDQQNVSPGSYADYDRALLSMAQEMEKQTNMDVVLETSPKLFQPGDCPNAALYCGWYSLARYVDAFDWVPGAVAYHLASSEATTLHKPESQVWCKRMLEEGVCATIGPVNEPYLAAFPRPNEFFKVLLTGKLTLVECYYRTKPYNSWMMTLIGDPLYRPFAVKNGE